MKRLLLITMVAFTAAGALAAGAVRQTSGSAPPLVRDASSFRTGDLIFVRGTSWRSRIVRWMSDGDTDFSHVGLVWRRSDGTPSVIHATPTLPDERTGGTVVEPLGEFLAATRVSQAALYRVQGHPGAAQRAASVAQTYAAQALPFDHDFDAATPGALYCTELVWRAYRAAGLHLPETFSTSSDPLLPATLSRSRLLTEVACFR